MREYAAKCKAKIIKYDRFRNNYFRTNFGRTSTLDVRDSSRANRRINLRENNFMENEMSIGWRFFSICEPRHLAYLHSSECVSCHRDVPLTHSPMVAAVYTIIHQTGSSSLLFAFLALSPRFGCLFMAIIIYIHKLWFRARSRHSCEARKYIESESRLWLGLEGVR